MLRLTRLVHFTVEATAAERSAVTDGLQRIGEHLLVAPTLPGVHNGGDLIAQFGLQSSGASATSTTTRTSSCTVSMSVHQTAHATRPRSATALCNGGAEPGNTPSVARHWNTLSLSPLCAGSGKRCSMRMRPTVANCSSNVSGSTQSTRNGISHPAAAQPAAPSAQVVMPTVS